MANISSARKLSMLARAAAHHAGRTRTFNAVWKAARAAAAHWGRILHQLWLEVTGFVFLALAGIGALSLTHEYTLYRAHHTGGDRILVATIFTLTFAWFGLSSFWRVRRKK